MSHHPLDSAAGRHPAPPAVRLALATFGILALELGIIRWTSSQIRVLAYFNNLMLIAAFLGMGLGVALGRRRPDLVHATLPLLLALALVVGFSDRLGLVNLRFPDAAVHLWGAEQAPGPWAWATKLLVVLALFWGAAAVFICAGSVVGNVFPQLAPLRAYSADLIGSLLGTLLFAAVTAANTPPVAWLALGCLPFVLLSRRWASILCAMAVLAIAWISGHGVRYSPYNRIEIVRDQHGPNGSVGYDIEVNRDFHQFMEDLSDAALASDRLPADIRSDFSAFRRVYDLPFLVGDARTRALVVGAGTGNDVQAALRAGYRSVHSVDIDGVIIDIGTELHPEQPYSDPRVHPIVNDARAFFEQYDGPPFDVVCYGFLDSHAMFSAMASLRLENYVYTEEGLRKAWQLVAPGGHLSVHFSVLGGEWIAERMYWTLTKATGRMPIMLEHALLTGRTFLVARDPSRLRLDRAAPFRRLAPREPMRRIATTSDDWPFLYLRPGRFPTGYVALLGMVLVTGAIAIRGVFGRHMLRTGFDAPLFCMGAAFLLIETRGVTNLSLLFGSTWMVNAAVFTGILVTVLAANILVERFGPQRLLPWFAPLFLALAALWIVPVGVLNQFPLLVRGVAGGLLTGLPVGFAGVILSTRLLHTRDATAALGSNLLGALLGGCLEYSSMWIGLRALVGVAALFYLTAFWFFLREKKGGAA